MSIPRRLRPSPAWAHSTGAIKLTGGLTGIDTRADLAERLYRYCWSYDERRVELRADCFTADAIWRGSVMGETAVDPHIGRKLV